MDIKTYKKDFEYSYTLGAFPTFELLESRPSDVIKVFYCSNFTDVERLKKKCLEKNVEFESNDKIISRLSDKGNVYVVGIFKKYIQEINNSNPHLVLVNPSDMGNLGTIIRTAVGFGILDLAIIEPAADIFNPKTVRASMGSVFRICHKKFSSFEEYLNYTQKNTSDFPKRDIFTFMLNGQKPLTVRDCPKPKLFSLVFGNEATGLPDKFLEYGTSVIIPQTKYVDSLNLTIAAGIGMYMFSDPLNNNSINMTHNKKNV